jgi:hypothetical protein
MVLFINKAKAYNLRENMALVKVNIDSFKKDVGGIFNRMVDKVVNKIEDKLENAVEDLFAKALKKIGLSDKIASEISARFGDALTVGLEDKYFQTFTSEMKRASCADIANNFNPTNGNIVGASAAAETYVDAIQRASNKVNLGEGLPTLQFPDHISDSYFMAFKFAQYKRPAPEAGAELKFVQAFALPLPKGIRESFEIGVSSDDVGMAGGMTDALQRALGKEGTDRGTAIRQSAIAMAYGKMVQSTGGFGSTLAQITGAVPNPHVQALFTGVPLRQHRFEWTFAPRNPHESKQLMTLLKALKAYSLPSYSSLGTAALAYPFLCQPSLKIKGKKDDDLIMFAPSLIQSVELNYSPQGLPAFFEGTHDPAFIEVSISMLETEMQTSNRYGRDGGDNLAAMEKQLIDTLQKGLEAAGVKDFNISTFIDEKSKELDETVGKALTSNQEPSRATTGGNQ